MIDNNQQKIINAMLQDLSGKYKIETHDEFADEFLKIFSKCGEKAKYDILASFIQRCSALSELGKRAIEGTKNFEKLKYLDFDLYSMHIKKIKNIRILYAFNGDTIIILLSAFDEKAGKKNTDYRKFIPIAKKRLNKYIG